MKERSRLVDWLCRQSGGYEQKGLTVDCSF